MKKLSICLLLFGYCISNFGLALSDTKPASKEEQGLNLLSSASIFKPLIADPKWPRFSLAYQYHMRGEFGRHVFAPNLAAVLPLFRRRAYDSRVYELSLHAGVFATMDIESNPTRLINSDYYVGPAIAITHNAFDWLFRIAHTSSHLGDELLLSGQGSTIKRINLSYETAEVIVGYNTPAHFRPYLGVGYIIHADPSQFKSLEALVGLDYRPTTTFIIDYIRPVFGVYSKVSKNSKWNPSFSIKGGLELKDKVVIGRSLQILLEFYTGNSIEGQFYKHKRQYIGTSLNVNF
jgi:hypothetical protein